MRTILCSRFHATFFLPRSRIRHDFEQKQITKAYFLCKICVRERLLISLNAVVCYLRCALFFNLKKRTMKGRWVKYLLMG
ncbi:murein transglycosylase A, partial [Escherichia coli]